MRLNLCKSSQYPTTEIVSNQHQKSTFFSNLIKQLTFSPQQHVKQLRQHEMKKTANLACGVVVDGDPERDTLTRLPMHRRRRHHTGTWVKKSVYWKLHYFE